MDEMIKYYIEESNKKFIEIQTELKLLNIKISNLDNFKARTIGIISTVNFIITAAIAIFFEKH